MPRLSVYVQDELWDRARAAEPNLNPSQIVQAALRRSVVEATKPPFARVRPAVAAAELEEIERGLAQQARERYEVGFQCGLRLSKNLAWQHIDHLAGCNWNLREWLDDEEAAYEAHFHERPPLFVILGVHEEVTDEIDQLLPAYEHEAAFRQGVMDALQTVWNAVMQGTGPGTSGSDAEEPGA